MKKSAFKILIFAPALMLTACGYGLKEIYTGNPYNSPVFVKNYFTDWDKSVDYRKDNSNITETKAERVLDYDNDLVFMHLDNPNFEEDYSHFQKCEPNWLNYNYVYDYYNEGNGPEDGTIAYGPDVALNKADNSFKYGVRSKLFDGRMFCGGLTTRSRVQVGPSNIGDYHGFGLQLSKECVSSSYFMCNFKCSLVTDKNQNLPGTYHTDLKIKLGFYLKNSKGFTYIPVSYTVDYVPTNSGDDHDEYQDAERRFKGRLNQYICFGFKLHDDKDTDNKYLDLSRLAGISFEYDLIDVYRVNEKQEHIPFDPGEDTMYHSVMLYEVSLPHSTWH